MDLIAKDSGPVTALAISQDQTFLAVGHATGNIHLYALAKPTIPARSVIPTTLAQVLTGRKEGHLVNSKILHIGFVGIRHTAIISSDENGLAFYHSLGRVLGLASNDTIRMLGKYPDDLISDPIEKITSPIDTKLLRTKKSIILDMAGLPLGPSNHSSDNFSLVAILTGTKLVVVGLRPSARTWWRAINSSEEDGSGAAGGGTIAWFPSFAAESETEAAVGEDPLLAFSWGKKVRFVRLAKDESKEGKGGINFIELKGFDCDSKVSGIQWYSNRVSRLISVD